MNKEEKKRLISNFVSLSFLQGTNYILPLITIPYLVRVIGPEKFGLLAFATAIIQYFILLTDFGFDLSGTRQIALHRDNKNKINEIFSALISVKIILALVSLLLLTLLIVVFQKLQDDWLIYYFTFGMVIGQLLMPIWLFQGMEQMKYITYLNIIAKVIFTAAIFIVVQNEIDFYLVPILNVLGALTAGTIGMWIIHKKLNIRYILPTYKDLLFQLKDGWHVFLSKLSISFYTTLNIVLLGVFTNNMIVGYYASGEKIVKAVVGLFTPFSQALFPLFTKMSNKSREDGLQFMRKVIGVSSVFTLTLSLLLFYYAKEIVDLILGDQYSSSVIIVQILSPLPLLVSLSMLLGMHIMLNYDKKKAFSVILASAGVINVVVALFLIPIYQSVGTAITLVLIEFFITLSMFIYLNKSGIHIWQAKVITN